MTGFEVRRSTRDPLIALSVSLADEFSNQVPAGTVIRMVAQAREALLAAGVRAGLVVAVESMTRARLHALAASGGSASQRRRSADGGTDLVRTESRTAPPTPRPTHRSQQPAGPRSGRPHRAVQP